MGEPGKIAGAPDNRQPLHWHPLYWHPRLALLAMAVLALLLFVPFLITVALSLQQDGASEPFAGPFGFAAWISVLGDRGFWLLLLRATAMAAATGLPLDRSTTTRKRLPVQVPWVCLATGTLTCLDFRQASDIFGGLAGPSTFLPFSTM